MNPNETKKTSSKDHGIILSVPDDGSCLDTIQLNTLEQSFRKWIEESSRSDTRISRRRILLVFLLIRYTGAKLNEVLSLNPFQDIDMNRHAVFYHSCEPDSGDTKREVGISEHLCSEIKTIISNPDFIRQTGNNLEIDPGFVRRKFYDRAQACGFQKHLGGPEMIRRARAVELMQNSMPLPAVQMMLGHASPNQTSSYVAFSEEEIQKITRRYVERESTRTTSARNSFFGKITTVQKGDIQSRIELVTMSGHSVSSMITNDSVERLALKPGRIITAEIKAPWVILQTGDQPPRCTAENVFGGTVTRIQKGIINTEYSVRISDDTELCSIAATQGASGLNLDIGDHVWIFFNSYAVILHAD